MPTIEFNREFQSALDLINQTDENVFITGRAGTGKSTLLNHFRKTTPKKIVVLAPTGVAAVNVSGQTIHSFFGFKPDITVSKAGKMKMSGDADIYKKLQTLVIDEISMVRADLFDCVDIFLRRFGPRAYEPFGGVQMVLIGDLYQLPPVVPSTEKDIFYASYKSPYFFSAGVINPRAQLFETGTPFKFRLIELQKIYRQSDRDFVNILNAIRDNTATSDHIAVLNKRLDQKHESDPHDLVVYLMTTNAMASTMNEAMLDKLNAKEFDFAAEVNGKFERNSYPTDERLRVKVGAQVMMQNNDSGGRWINGTMGKIEKVIGNAKEGYVVYIKLTNDETVEVGPHRWDMYNFFYDGKTKSIESETVGSFTQFPFRLAWAVTIHKAQGKTFDKMVLDIGSGTFAPGQLYVALSRVRTLGGLILKRPILPRHVWTDQSVMEFLGGLPTPC